MLSPQFLTKSLSHKQSRLLLTAILAGLTLAFGVVWLVSAPGSRAASDPAVASAPAPPAALPALDVSRQITTTPLDVVVAFDISASMEDQTTCHDCWVRTSYNPQWPNNGYFNPLPYNKAWADANPGTGNQSIPASQLCTAYPPQPFITGTLKYLVIEAELYSRNVGDWGLDVRTPGQGFWAIQRGSRGSTGLEGSTNGQGNSAGDPANQSSNVCRPNVPGNQIDCTVGVGAGDNVCSAADGSIAADCSAYIAARPFETYTQFPGSLPALNGAAYNADCFNGSNLSGACWSSSPFYPVVGNGPSFVPYVEYDFTPTWSEPTTYIWIRAIGGGEQAYTWAGPSPDQITPDLNGGGVANNITPWRKVIYWQVDNGLINQRKDNLNADYDTSPAEGNTGHFQGPNTWRDNRAENNQWRWIRLGSTTTNSGIQATLKLYQGSAGYKVDKIVFTNDSSGSTPEAGPANPTIPIVLRRDANGGTAAATDYGNQLGPPASFGSATREACNVCNPAYGYTVNPAQCSCKRTGIDTTNGGYGSGLGCTIVSTTTNQLQSELVAGLYSGLQPIRSAQEAVKHFAATLNPAFDQLGLVPFAAGSDNTTAQNDSTRRSKLQCLRWGQVQLGNAALCYDTGLGTPISFTQVISAVEKHWPAGGTDIAIGLREGLEELGVNIPGVTATTSNCTATINDGNACDRGGAARRMLILLTDGYPNSNPGNCSGSNGRPDLWDGLLGTEDADFECAMYYAYLAAQSNVTLFTIGLGAGPDPDLLTAMATGVDPRGDQPDARMFDASCGQYFPAAKPTDLELIFDQIASRARNCVPNAPALTLDKSDTPNLVWVGAILTYTLTVTNSGSISATGVVITDILDSRVTLAAASDGGVYNAGVVTWDVDLMPVGQAISRTLVVTVGNVAHGTILTNTAWVTSIEGISYSNLATTTVSQGGMRIVGQRYRSPQGEYLPIRLENHFSSAGPYDIYLLSNTSLTYKICSAINTPPTVSTGDFYCFVPFNIPPGFYTLFSTFSGDVTLLAVDAYQVEIFFPGAPRILINHGMAVNIVTINSLVTIQLISHHTLDEPFNIYLISQITSSESKIFDDIPAANKTLTWRVPDTFSGLCPVGGTPCLIQSRRSNTGFIYAQVELYINSIPIYLPLIFKQ